MGILVILYSSLHVSSDIIILLGSIKGKWPNLSASLASPPAPEPAIVDHMARLLAILFLSLAILAGANDAFDEANLIRSVTDRIDSLETSLLGFLGQTRNALHFARFAHR